MAINLMHIALSFISDKNNIDEFPNEDEEDDEEEWEGGNMRNKSRGVSVEYPSIRNVSIRNDPDTDHENIVHSLETIITRMVDIHEKCAMHRTAINWLPLHYLMYMRSKPSLELVNLFGKLNPKGVKTTVDHISPLVHLSTVTGVLSQTDEYLMQISTPMKPRDDADSASMSASQVADNVLPSLMNKTMSFSQLMMTTNNNASGILNMKKIDEGRNDENNDETVKKKFSPLSLAKERNWTEIFGVLKQISVKILSDQLKIVLDRGITESAYGSPRLVTPLPKLVPKSKHQEEEDRSQERE